MQTEMNIILYVYIYMQHDCGLERNNQRSLEGICMYKVSLESATFSPLTENYIYILYIHLYIQ